MRLPVGLTERHQANRWCLPGVKDIKGVALCVRGRLLRGSPTIVKCHDAQVLLNNSTTRTEQDRERCAPRDVLTFRCCNRSFRSLIWIGNWYGVWHESNARQTCDSFRFS